MAPRKYGILIAGEPDQTVIDQKGTFEQMFLDLLRDNPATQNHSGKQQQQQEKEDEQAQAADDEGQQQLQGQEVKGEEVQEEWRLYYAFKGQLPSQEELSELSGIVVTGSVADAFGDDEWLRELRCTVRAAVEGRKQVLGICFGHQLVGTTLGARVGRAGCWEVGARQVDVAADARRQLEESGASWAALLPDQICVHEFHQDQVLEVPAGATLLASSERCAVEMYAVGSNVLCMQGHPEFDREVVQLLAEPRLAAIDHADVALMRDSLAALPVAQQAEQLQRLCKAFLKGSSHS